MRSSSLGGLFAVLALIGGGSSIGCGGGGDGTTQASSAESAGAEASFAQISVADVAAGIASPDRRLSVYDANNRERFEQNHVPGATWVDYHTLSREQLPSDASTPLVFYCYNEQCEASHRAAEGAIALGFSNVSVMGAGIAGWIAAGQPIESATAEGATAAP